MDVSVAPATKRRMAAYHPKTPLGTGALTIGGGANAESAVSTHVGMRVHNVTPTVHPPQANLATPRLSPDALACGVSTACTYHQIYINANVVEPRTSQSITIKIGTTQSPVGGASRLTDAHAGEFTNLFNFTFALPIGEAERIQNHYGNRLNDRDPVEAMIHTMCADFNLSVTKPHITQREMFRMPRSTVLELLDHLHTAFPLKPHTAGARATVEFDQSGLDANGGLDLFYAKRLLHRQAASLIIRFDHKGHAGHNQPNCRIKADLLRGKDQLLPLFAKRHNWLRDDTCHAYEQCRNHNCPCQTFLFRIATS